MWHFTYSECEIAANSFEIFIYFSWMDSLFIVALLSIEKCSNAIWALQ